MRMLSSEEYRELRRKDMDQALGRVQEIRQNPDPLVAYKETRPIMDLKHMMETSARLYKNRTAFLVKHEKGGKYMPVSYQHLMEDINALGTALLARGFGGRNIALAGENSYEWAVSYLAVVCGVGAIVPIDKELFEDDIQGIIVSSESSVVLCSNKIAERFEDIDEKLSSHFDLIVNIGKSYELTNGRYEKGATFSELIEEGKELLAQGNRDYLDAQIFKDEMAVLLYTSGTTGKSKGVMLSHWNVVEDIIMATTVLYVYDTDVFLSVLPLHHTYACTCDFLVPMYAGACIAHCDGLKYIQKNFAEVRPTMFLAVPLIYERLYKKIWKTAIKEGKDKKLRAAIMLSNKLRKIGIDITDKLFKDILKIFGGRVRIMISGGAAVNPRILEGFRDFGINALQGYGLTECSPMATLNPDIKPKSASVGRAFPRGDVRIDLPNEDGVGEICIKGDFVMLGYYKNQEATNEVIKDGWFYSGDLGFIDDEGYVYITGRKKNVIITKNGKNVFPEELEEHISNMPLVDEVMVWGDDSKVKEDTTIVATIVPDWEEVEHIIGDIADKQDAFVLERVQALLWDGVDAINNHMPLYKKIKHIVVRPEPFEKNTSTKIKRFEVSNRGV